MDPFLLIFTRTQEQQYFSLSATVLTYKQSKQCEKNVTVDNREHKAEDIKIEADGAEPHPSLAFSHFAYTPTYAPWLDISALARRVRMIYDHRGCIGESIQ